MASFQEFVDSVSKISSEHILSLMAICLFFVPSLGVILIYFPDLVNDLDIFKLLFISFGFGAAVNLPLFLATIFLAIDDDNVSSFAKNSLATTIISIGATAILSILIQMFFYFFLPEVDFRLFIATYVLIFFIIFFGIYISTKVEKVLKKRKNQ